MEQIFQIETTIRWSEIDLNGHTRNSAYLDLASHCRICYFDSHGFSAGEFSRLRIGPVIFKDEITYFKETHLGDHLAVNLKLEGLSPKGFRFALRNEFMRAGDETAVIIQSRGAWLDLNRRKLIDPPQALLEVLDQLARTENFTRLQDRTS